MFFAYRNTVDPIMSQIMGGDVSVFAQVQRIGLSRFFLVEYGMPSNELYGRDIALIDNVDHLCRMKKDPEFVIHKVFLVSPGYLNKSESWQMQELKEVWYQTAAESDWQTIAIRFVTMSEEEYWEGSQAEGNVTLERLY